MRIVKAIGIVILFILFATAISGGIKGMQRGTELHRKQQQAQATRQDFIKDCTSDPESSETFCACIYDGMGEQRMKDAYAYYQQSGEYNYAFKNWAIECKEEL